MASCPVRAEQVLDGHGRPLRTTLSRPSDCAKYEIALDVALHFGPEDHSCAEKLNKNNGQVGREPLRLFKSGLTKVIWSPRPASQKPRPWWTRRTASFCNRGMPARLSSRRKVTALSHQSALPRIAWTPSGASRRDRARDQSFEGTMRTRTSGAAT